MRIIHVPHRDYFIVTCPETRKLLRTRKEEFSAVDFASRYNGFEVRIADDRVLGLAFPAKMVHRQFKPASRFGYSLPKPGTQAERDCARVTCIHANNEILEHIGKSRVQIYLDYVVDGNRNTQTFTAISGAAGTPVMEVIEMYSYTILSLPAYNEIIARTVKTFVNMELNNELNVEPNVFGIRITADMMAALRKHGELLPYHYRVQETEDGMFEVYFREFTRFRSSVAKFPTSEAAHAAATAVLDAIIIYYLDKGAQLPAPEECDSEWIETAPFKKLDNTAVNRLRKLYAKELVSD